MPIPASFRIAKGKTQAESSTFQINNEDVKQFAPAAIFLQTFNKASAVKPKGK